MRHGARTSLLFILSGAICAPYTVLAQAPNDVLLFDNQTDFLLPSYFDTPAPTTQPATPPKAQPLVPQNVPADIDILNEIFGDQVVSSQSLSEPAPQPQKQAQNSTQTFYPTPKSIKQETQQPLLTPLAPLPKLPEAPIPNTKKPKPTSTYATKLLAKETGKSKSNIQLPKDIRLQFAPYSTQLTDSAIKWISAYALHVQKDPTLVVNLRVSYRNWDQQQARLGLIMQIMMEKGLPARQIQIFQSDRDPDTIVIGADSNPNQTHANTSEDSKKVIKDQKTLSW
ncbi:MAG: hypothetical protein II938_00450 [Alphaproteobacteria bacterium]|nr:hypothetical protein [Alphaproteobacteria bacterium]